MSYQHYRQIREHLLAQAGLTEKAPSRYKYFVYKTGKVVGEFDSKSQADTECKRVGGVIESTESNNWTAYWDAIKTIDTKAQQIWLESFRTLWAKLNDKEFDVCYAEACRRGESYGYDEVANYMYDVVEFMRKVQGIGR